MNPDNPLLPQEKIDFLHKQCKSLMLATLDVHGNPEVSYTPFAFYQEQYYIFISQLAAHTSNLQRQPNAAILIIEDEASTRNIYARLRLSYQVQTKFVLPNNPIYPSAMTTLKNRVGTTLDVLSELSDFHLLCLTPLTGTLIVGFGKTYQIDGNEPNRFVLLDEANVQNSKGISD